MSDDGPSKWNHRICETCWTGGIGVTALGRIRTPVQVRDDEPAPCCTCRELVIVSAIYHRASPESMVCQGQHEPPWKWSRVHPHIFLDPEEPDKADE